MTAECFRGPLDGAEIRVMEHFWLQLRVDTGDDNPPIRQISLDGPEEHGPLPPGWAWEGRYVLREAQSRGQMINCYLWSPCALPARHGTR